MCYDNEETKNEKMAARQTIEVKVEPASRNRYNVEFSMTLNSSYISYEEFNQMPMLRRIFVKKLSELFGDKDTSSIVVSDYTRGSLIVIWHNKTLPMHTCPEEEIEKLRKVSPRMHFCYRIFYYLNVSVDIGNIKGQGRVG